MARRVSMLNWNAKVCTSAANDSHGSCVWPACAGLVAGNGNALRGNAREHGVPLIWFSVTSTPRRRTCCGVSALPSYRAFALA